MSSISCKYSQLESGRKYFSQISNPKAAIAEVYRIYFKMSYNHENSCTWRLYCACSNCRKMKTLNIWESQTPLDLCLNPVQLLPLTALESLHRLPIKSVFEKVELRQVCVTVSHTQAGQRSLYVLPFCSPMFKIRTVNNAEMKLFHIQDLDMQKTTFAETVIHFISRMFTKLSPFTTRK